MLSSANRKPLLIISITIFAIYVVVYRFILYRLPILYAWKEEPASEAVTEPVRGLASPAYEHAGVEFGAERCFVVRTVATVANMPIESSPLRTS